MLRNRDLHYASTDEIYSFQSKRLQEEVLYLQMNSPFYREYFNRHRVNAHDIKTLDDLHSLPTTSKEDLQRENSSFICVERHSLVDYLTTSGTSGDPVVFALTESDLDRLAYNEASSFHLAGCRAGDILQIMTTMDRRFMAGLAYYLGGRAAGLGVVRVGSGIPQLQWDSIQRIGANVCVVVPSFLLKLTEYARRNGIDPSATPLKKAICIGEAIRRPDGTLSTLGTVIQQEWPELELYSTYASTEMQTAFTDCECHRGGHLPPDLIIAEVLDEQGHPLPPDAPGEVTITTLGVRGMPLLRFRTGDICSYTDSPCSCGRRSRRLSPVIGRKSQMLKLKGTTVYPPAIFDILNSHPAIRSYLVEVYTNSQGTDQVQIKIGMDNPNDYVIKQLREIFRARIRVAPDIEFEEIALIESRCQAPGSRKEVRFFDFRSPILSR